MAAALLEGQADEHGPHGAQVAVSQFAADVQDQILQGGIGPAGVVRGTGTVGPVDAVEALAFGPLHPEGDGGDADAESASDGAPGLACADGGYQGTTALGLTLCLLTGLPPSGSPLKEW